MNPKIKIDYLNNFGVGVGFDDFNKKTFIPNSLPLEIVEYKIDKSNSKFNQGKIVNILKESSFRIDPECPYYLKCGGCNLQHLSEEFYIKFKKQNFSECLIKAGYADITVPDPILIPKYSRRRTSFTLRSDQKSVVLGYKAQGSDVLVDIDHCLVLSARINDFIVKIKNMFKGLKATLSIIVTDCENGLDVSIKTENKVIECLKKLDSCTQISRLILNDQIVFQHQVPVIDFNGIKISISADAFLQPSNYSHKILVDFIVNNVSKSTKSLIDLYSGCGTYSIPLSMKHKVLAVEGEENMVNILKKYSSSKLQVIKRDLHKNPFDFKELSDFDTVIINPPRNGAFNQVGEIAKSNVKQVIMISCSLNSLSVDLSILKKAGFEIKNLESVDQFLFTHHLEAVINLIKIKK